MNILLWFLQIGLALHTLMGAVWKFSRTPEQTMPSLKAIPEGAWLAMSVIEILCAVGLVLPMIKKTWSNLISIAAIVIAAEMLIFCGLHLASGETNYGPIIYWLVVATLCAFIAYGRRVLRPL
jgi:hypothetical protein